MELGPLSRAVRQLRRMAGGLTITGPSDRQLLEAFAAGDRTGSFERLVERHGSMVYGVCRRALGNDADADDAFQATFLVLARKAASSLWQDSVANWLYGVAYRTALRVRCRNAHRRFHENRASRSTEPSGSDGVDWREVRAVLDEELMRLPEKFRLPLVLCCLHDHTVEEAATTLQLPATTVKGRLQQGRELLRLRLERRGITVGVGVLAVTAPAGMASAVPAPLILSTIELAAGGPVSGPISALANEVMRMATWVKLKVGAAALLGVCLAFGGGTMMLRTEATPLSVPSNGESNEALKAAKASESMVRDGLEVTVKPTKAVFGAGEIPTMEITYTNKTKKPLRLHDLGYEIKLWDCERADDVAPWRSGPYEYAARAAGNTPTVGAGEHVTVKTTIRGPFSWQGPQPLEIPAPPKGRSALARDTLQTGTYKAVARVVFADDPAKPDEKRAPCWVGELTTKPVEFEVSDKVEGAKASEPAEKNGLSVIVKPTKAVFALGEDPSFLVSYTNKNASLTIQLHHLGVEVQNWRFTDQNGKGPWQSDPRQYDQFEKQLRISPNLEPGKQKEQTYTAPGRFVWKGEQLQPIARDHLPTGKYRGTALLRFPDSAIKTEGIVSWSGELTTKPVEFEVSDQKAAKIITEADKGKTTAVKVGDVVEVHLQNEKALTGWEGGLPADNKTVVDAEAMRFVPSPTANDPVIGTFIFHYVMAREGQVTIDYRLLSPAGPGFKGPREKTVLHREFKITLQVEK